MKSNDTYFNVLCSFAYLYKSKEFCDRFFRLHREGIINGMIDSGAFTLFNAKESREWLTLDNYCKFISEHEQDCEKYVMLDKVGDDVQSKVNYEIMVKRGFRPMYVLTMFDKDMRYFRDTMNVNRNCCVAGGVTTKSDWMTKRFQDAYKGSLEKALIHGLGYVTFPRVLQLPLASVDSSSWIAGAQRFGSLFWFDKGLKGMSYKDIIKKKKVPEGLRTVLDDIEVSVSDFMNKDNFHGALSIPTLLSIIAHNKYQKYCYKHGLRLFLAVGSISNLRSIEVVYENIGNITYQKYRKLLGK